MKTKGDYGLQKNSRILIVSILVVVLVFGTLALLYYEGAIKLPSSTGTGRTDYFTIVEEDRGPLAGMNGSYYKNPGGAPWPVMTVHVGDTVVITVINNGTSFEPHGFGIAHYLQGVGITISPGQSHTITFLANVAGEFRVYCTIECAIHPLMQNGLLNVTS